MFLIMFSSIPMKAEFQNFLATEKSPKTPPEKSITEIKYFLLRILGFLLNCPLGQKTVYSASRRYFSITSFFRQLFFPKKREHSCLLGSFPHVFHCECLKFPSILSDFIMEFE